MRYADATTLSTLFSLLAGLAAAFPSPCSSPSWTRFTTPILSRLWGSSNKHGAVAHHSDPLDISRRPNPLAARYGEDIVLRFNISTADEAKAIADASEDLYLDIWEFNENWVDIRLAKDVVPSLLGLLPSGLQHAHAPLMPESALVDVISRSMPTPDQPGFSPDLRPSSKDLFFSDYQPLSVMEPWMRLMASMFPTHTRLIDIGLSHEGRDIKALRVGVHPGNNDENSQPRQTIIISGGLHSREWISTSTVNYVANQLITSYGRSQFVTRALESFDWVFIPTLNPDGYVYTWETDRLWRKNRQPTSLRFCRGIDLDRSFGFQWDGDAVPSNPCSESYAGEGPWQATEAKRFADWARNEIENNNVEFVALIDLHSYSQQVLYPYSYSCSAAPPTLENLEELALGLAKAMRLVSHGHRYKATSACEGNVYLNQAKSKDGSHVMPRIEPGGGSVLDWFYHELRVKYAYQIKLRDEGSYGFLLPKENIVPQGKELLSAIKYLGKYLMGQVGLQEEEEASVAPASKKPEKMELREAMEAGDDGDEAPRVVSEPAQEVLDGMEEMQWELKRRRRR